LFSLNVGRHKGKRKKGKGKNSVFALWINPQPTQPAAASKRLYLAVSRQFRLLFSSLVQLPKKSVSSKFDATALRLLAKKG